MALTPEQVKELKAQLSQQIQHMHPEQKKQAQEQIDSMSSEALEAMIKEQQARQKSGDGEGPEKGVFRMIIDREIPSKIVAENEDCIAVLDIKPISSGHIVIIPKKQAKEEKSLPSSTFKLAKAITKQLKKKLKAKDSAVLPETKFGEWILNVIPIYDKPLGLFSPRKEASKEDLEKQAEKLKIVEKLKKKVEKIKIKKQKLEVIKMQRRIP